MSFSLVPDYIKRDSRLTSTDKLIFAELLRLSHKQGYAWPSYDFLAEAVGCSRSQAIRAVKVLVGCDLVIKQLSDMRKQAHASNRYWVKQIHFVAAARVRTSNVINLSDYRARYDAKQKAARQILSIASKSGLNKNFAIEQAVRAALQG